MDVALKIIQKKYTVQDFSNHPRNSQGDLYTTNRNNCAVRDKQGSIKCDPPNRSTFSRE